MSCSYIFLSGVYGFMTFAQDGELEITEDIHFKKMFILKESKKNINLDKTVEFVNVFFFSKVRKTSHETYLKDL